jgi:DNA repair photolyase/ParB-like chromosome segregation protein Spo0J
VEIRLATKEWRDGRTKGTRQWSDKTINCAKGCKNGCRYCYARKLALRRKQIVKAADWENMTVSKTAYKKSFPRKNLKIMFPSSHDIIDVGGVKQACFDTLTKLLKRGQEVVVVTKPRPAIITEMTETFRKYVDQLEFRFTITSDDPDVLAFWEPGAPTFPERLESLRHAWKEGFNTSVSMEPFLTDPLRVIRKVDRYVANKVEGKESIWLGLMSGIPENGPDPRENDYYDRLRKNYEPKQLERICKALRGHGKIAWKDSMVNALIKSSRGRMCLDVPVSCVQSGDARLRSRMDPKALKRLEDCVKTDGLLQPIVVCRQKGDAPLTVVSGERRLAAYRKLKLPHIPAVVLNGDVDAKKLLEIQITASLHREKLDPLDEARAYEKYLEGHDACGRQAWESALENVNWNRDDGKKSEIIKKLLRISGKSATTIWRRLRLLDPKVKDATAAEETGTSQAEAARKTEGGAKPVAQIAGEPPAHGIRGGLPMPPSIRTAEAPLSKRIKNIADELEASGGTLTREQLNPAVIEAERLTKVLKKFLKKAAKKSAARTACRLQAPAKTAAVDHKKGRKAARAAVR